MIRTRRRASGFTLIELMISLVMGVSITAVGLTLYTQMSTTRIRIQAELALQENSYYVTQTLKQLIHQAGYRSVKTALLSTRQLPLINVDQSFSEIDGKWERGEFVRVLNNGLAIRFEGSSSDTGEADGSMINCLGDAIAEGEIGEIILTVVDGSLLCTSDDEIVELIVEADGILIDRIAVLWGVDTDNDNSVDEYLPAVNGVITSDNLLAIRVLLLLSSDDQVASTNVNYTFNAVEYTSTDSRLRRDTTTTVQIKN